jgi:opacity protein-like surface antigen
MLLPLAAEAQSTFAFRGFVDGGSTTFTAKKSFKAILGSESGIVYGGGVEAVLPQHVFFNLRASRFQKTGERVFIFEEQEFRLGIPETITITPLELMGGYRFDFGSWIVPYAGAGAGWHMFTDTSKFSDASENVKKTYQGYQLVGGAEFRLASWLGAAAEAQWSRVPKALGQDDNSVSKMYSETDLGGSTFRVKIVLGQ